MELVELGKTGRQVARIGFGAMRLSIQGRPERHAAKQVVHHALTLGVNFFDTADVYCLGEGDLHHNEMLLREAIDEHRGARPPEVVIATKGGMTRPEGRWERNGRPRHLRQACEGSIRALRTDPLDLYQLHAPDPNVPFEDSVGEISRLYEEGKVRAVGLSNVSEEQVRSAQEIVPITSVQNRFNPWDRADEESGLIRFCDEQGITYLPYSPVGGGRRVQLLRDSEALQAIGARLDASPEQLVLAWMLSKSPRLVPIPSATRTASLESSVRAEAIRLDQATIEELEDVYTTLEE